MKIEHIKASDLITSQWSGGTTTQLAIYPQNAEYKERNFQFRISTATVEAEESTFTKLPGVSRKLMILDGEIRIEHSDHHSKTLKKFEQDEFSGDWDTISFGKATDFNLMTISNAFGDIEAIPLEDSVADVIVSNCVLNLVPDKVKAFNEIYRILKPGAHFCVSDIVIQGEMSEELKHSAAMYTGCVSGAIKQEEYLGIINQAGFVNVEIKKSKRIDLPLDLLKKYLTEQGIKEYNESLKGIFSITVVGYKI